MPRKKPSPKPKRSVGRPPVKYKKKHLQVMLDPRYIQHFRKVAREKNIPPQDLARMALHSMVPDPFNPFIIWKKPMKSQAKKRKP